MVSNKEMRSVFQRFATREADVWVRHRLSELPNLQRKESYLDVIRLSQEPFT